MHKFTESEKITREFLKDRYGIGVTNADVYEIKSGIESLLNFLSSRQAFFESELDWDLANEMEKFLFENSWCFVSLTRSRTEIVLLDSIPSEWPPKFKISIAHALTRKWDEALRKAGKRS